MLDDFHRLSSPSTRASVAWFVEHLPATVQLVLVVAHRSGAAARHAAGARPAARAARRRAALHGRRGGRVPQRPPRARARRRPTSSCSWRGPRAGPPGLYLAALSLAGPAGQARARRGLRRHERACRRLPRRRGARRPRARAAGVHAAHLGARAPLRAALRRRPRAPTRRRRARVARALEPVPLAARRSPPLVSLPPPLRPDPAGRARAARARARARAAPARVRLAQRARHDRRGHPPRRRGAAPSPRPAS